MPPSLLLNLKLSFNIHNINQQTITHLTYIDIQFPNPIYINNTFHTLNKIINTKISKNKPNHNTIHVHTINLNQHNKIILSFEQKTLIQTKQLNNHPNTPIHTLNKNKTNQFTNLPYAPTLTITQTNTKNPLNQPFHFENFTLKNIYTHNTKHTINKNKHIILTSLIHNTHPLHFDTNYYKNNSFTKKQIIYNKLILS